jgi:hypothetical protein
MGRARCVALENVKRLEPAVRSRNGACRFHCTKEKAFFTPELLMKVRLLMGLS